ncbi:MAG: cysteine desulfurase family protein [Bradymonadia bacterium]
MSLYLDCNASTPIDDRVQETLLTWLAQPGNPGNTRHPAGRRARYAIEQARATLAAAVGCPPDGVVFTSGATESNNMALFGVAGGVSGRTRSHILTTPLEHSSVKAPLQYLSWAGYDVETVPVGPSGRVDPAEIAARVRPDTCLISVVHVQGETGIIQPIEAIAEAVADRQLIFHVDAAQGFAHDHGPLAHPAVDLVSLSAHKMYGPQGVGALIIKGRATHPQILAPRTYGGGQEGGFRSGTPPVALVAAMGHAVELVVSESADRSVMSRAWGVRFDEAMAPFQPVVFGDGQYRVPHVRTVAFPHLDAPLAVELLSPVVSISAGPACSAGQPQTSPALLAMGVAPEVADGAMRFSWCHETPSLDVAAFQAAIHRVLAEAVADPVTTGEVVMPPPMP